MEDKKNKPVPEKNTKKPTGKSATGKPLDGIEINPQLDDKRRTNEDFAVLTATLQERKALTLAQRQQRGRQLKRIQPKIQRAKEISQARLAGPEKLQRRAEAKARAFLKSRISARKDIPYAELTTSEKIQVDTAVAKKTKLIKRIAARLLPKLRKAEFERLKTFHSGAPMKSLHTVTASEDFSGLFNDLNAKSTLELVDIIENAITKFEREGNPISITLRRMLNSTVGTDPITETLIKKAEKTGVPFSTLKEVFERGLSLYVNESNQTPEQVAFNRVNSYIAKGRAWTLDADLREEKLINDKLDNVFEATYRGKKVPLNKSMKGDVKKSKVYVDPDYHAKVHQDLQWHAGRNRSNSTGAANYHHLITLDDPSHIETYYEKTVHPILKKHNYPTPPEGPGDGGNPKYHAAVQEIIKNWRNEPRWMHNEETEVKEAYHTGLSTSTAKKREAHWKKMEKYSDKDDRAYQDAPGDKEARKKPMPQSVHTKKYHAMYGEDVNESLWANIHAKRKRIKAGSGERMRKPGEKGAPTPAGLKSAQEAACEIVDRRPVTLKSKRRQQEVQKKIIDESNNKPYVKSFSQTASGEHSGWKASNKHGKVKYFGKDFKASAMKHAGVSEDTSADREVGTTSLAKKYKKDTPGQDKADLNETFNMAWTAGIGVTLSAEECGIRMKPAFELHPDVIDAMEEVRSADVEGVVVRTADGKTLVRKQKRNKKIIGTGNLTDGKPDDTV